MRLNVYCLALLLVTGSVRSYAQAEPTKLFLPKDSESPELTKRANPAFWFTLILAEENKIIYYPGEFKKGVAAEKTDYRNVRAIIKKKKKSIGDSIVVLIKPGGGASYKNTVDILDEMFINDIKRYVLIDISKEEEAEFGLKPFEPNPPVVHTPVATSKPADYSNKDVLLIRLDNIGAIEYGFGKGTDQRLTRLTDSDTARFGTIIKELITGKSGYEIIVKGNNDAKYENFKRVIDALKANNLFKFQMITEKD